MKDHGCLDRLIFLLGYAVNVYDPSCYADQGMTDAGRSVTLL
jgi:hypothetical protein